ncbi:MAG: DUF493 domain-containing protein [Ottowia sp.]|nr:DUF493 domain-containing protein [Ottowia sp.]
MTTTPAAANAPSERTSLIDYPCLFPIKVVGENGEHFVHAITSIAREFDPEFDAAAIELRESGGGRYLGITLQIHATSRAQLDALYHALGAQPQVRWVL